MAIYHLDTHTIGRAAGHSAVAAAAYRSASSLVDERTGETFDFTRKSGVMSSRIITPAGVPVPERAVLWNAAEVAEKRKDARVAREWRMALPHELNKAEREALAMCMGQAIADRYGVAVDVCVHAPDREGDDRNFHVHMLATTRIIGADGQLGAKAVIELANKDRQKAGIPGTSQGDIVEFRQQWADLANEALERAGVSARINHRSYVDQGVELTPTRHIGSAAVAMARHGLEADRIDIHNADREEQARQIIERPEIILDKITATQAVFTRRDIAIELNRYIDDPDQFQVLLAGLENSPQLVEMEPASGRDPAKFSTREMIDTERAMVESAERLAQTGRHGVSGPITNAAIGGAGTLSAEQQNAVRHVLKPGRLAVVIGDAGTGKSFSMKVAREAWQAQGFNVRGAALAGKAADELQAGSGIASRTLASLEYAWKNGKDKLTSRDVLVIDEAGMIGSRQLGRVLKAAEQAGAKVVLLGDDKQLATIEAGAAFRGVVQHVGAAEITEVRRQKEAWARQAGQQLARGSVADGLAAYAERGHVQIHDSRDAARAALAAAYVGDQGKGSQIILAHSNKDVQALNEAVREARKERGELAGAARFVTERGGREFAPGDRIAFLKNNRDLGVKNGTLGTVERAGDGSLAVRLDNGEARQVLASQYAAIDHGYAVTIHKAQGVTVDRAYLLATPGMDRSLAYVGMTRHREAATLFAGADDFTDRRAGRLVEHGAAPYENKPENRQSYFATLENDKGERHTIWGVDLERAIAASGAKRGERIGLEHGGSETVRLLDGTTAERNTWHVCSTDDLAAEKLVQVLGRERPKESTLDFADRRGFDGESVMRRWLERGRARVAELAGKMQRAMRRGLERRGRPDLMPATDIAGTPIMQRPQQIVQPVAPQRPQVERDHKPAAPSQDDLRAGIEAARAQFEAYKLAEAGKAQAREAFERFNVEQRAADLARQQAAEKAAQELARQREEAERKRQAEQERERLVQAEKDRQAKEEADQAERARIAQEQAEKDRQAKEQAQRQRAAQAAQERREKLLAQQERQRLRRLSSPELAQEIARLRPPPVRDLLERDPAVIEADQERRALEEQHWKAQARESHAKHKAEQWRQAHPLRAKGHDAGVFRSAYLDEQAKIEGAARQEWLKAAPLIEDAALRGRHARSDAEMWITVEQTPIRAKIAELEVLQKEKAQAERLAEAQRLAEQQAERERQRVTEKIEVMAQKRQMGAGGYRDTSSVWQVTPQPLRDLIDEYNRQPKETQAAILEYIRDNQDVLEQVAAMLQQREQQAAQWQQQEAQRRREAQQAIQWQWEADDEEFAQPQQETDDEESAQPKQEADDEESYGPG